MPALRAFIDLRVAKKFVFEFILHVYDINVCLYQSDSALAVSVRSN